MLTLLGLHDDYSHDGRALFELADTNALPVALRGHTASLTALVEVFKQLNACVGQFGAGTITASSKAITSTSPADTRYQVTEDRLSQLGANRDALAAQILNDKALRKMVHGVKRGTSYHLMQVVPGGRRITRGSPSPGL